MINSLSPTMMDSRTDSQKKKIRKLPKSPQKIVITGQTQQNITTKKAIETDAQFILPQTKNGSNFQKHVIDISGIYYEGPTVNNSPQGEGALYYPNGQLLYKGFWQNGARNGYGNYIYPDGSEYRGDWLDNFKHGQGIYFNKQGQKYQGEWVQNVRHGRGKLQLMNGVVLDGQWQNDEFVSGLVVYRDGSSYQGSLKNYSRSGQGTYNYTGGQKYTGRWENNMKNGAGEYLFANGDKLNGSFKDNLKHGMNFSYLWKDKNYWLMDGKFNYDRYESGNVTKNKKQ